MKIKQVNVPVYQIELTEQEIKDIRSSLGNIKSSGPVMFGNCYPTLVELYSTIAGVLS